MADTVTREVRSRIMSHIRSKDTKPEMVVRHALHAAGFRYVLHDRRLPGHPDLVLPRHRAVVLVHGCFWHGHTCRFFRLPGTRTAFWAEKIGRNRERDAAAIDALLASAWRVAVVWECALRSGEATRQKSVVRLIHWVASGRRRIEVRG